MRTPFARFLLLALAVTGLGALDVAAANSVASAAPAPGQRIAPPGNSAATEYMEVVPGPGGNHTVPPGAGTGLSSTPGPGGAVLPAPVLHRLQAAGQTGRAVANLASATAPGIGRAAEHVNQFRKGTGVAPLGAQGGAGSILHALFGSGGGLGVGLPILIGSALLMALLVGLRRRRQS
jgi:hypothetical protein